MDACMYVYMEETSSTLLTPSSAVGSFFFFSLSLSREEWVEMLGKI